MLDMGLFSGKKTRQKVCPQHGVFNPLVCDRRCRAITAEVHQPRQIELDPKEESTPDPSNGWW